jgi:GGDEF domain-containing protein
MQDLPGRRRVPPPLDAPVAGLVQKGDELAQRWLVALLGSRRLEAAATVPVAELTSQGPALCSAIVRALVSESELERLRGDRDLAPLAASAGRLAGASDGGAAVEAIELLRAVVWEAIEEESARAGAEHAVGWAPLGDRLAHVCAVLTAATLSAMGVPRAKAPPAADELAPVRAARGEGAPLWVEALERQVAQGGRFALLLVELDGADQLRASEPAGAADAAFARAARAIRAQIRRGDLVAHEEDGRTWVIAPELGRAGANALAERIAAAIERAASLRAVPLAASVGVAIFPEDAPDGQSLSGRAEEDMFATRAQGARGDGGAGGGPEPDGGVRPGPRAVG